MKKTILIIEDDPNIAQLIQIYLEREDFRAIIFSNGEEALHYALAHHVDLIILDRMLPGIEGLEILKGLRQEKDTPVLIISAKGDDIDKIIGLELGADDYLSKPFHPQEMLVRVKNILKRSQQSFRHEVKPNLQFKDITLSSHSMQAHRQEEALNLSALEFKILYAMVTQKHKTWKREELLEVIHPDHEKYIYDRSIDAHIKNLRKKLKDSAKKPTYIQSVFGLGYRLTLES